MSGRAQSPKPGDRLSVAELTELRKYADELDACKGSNCLMYLKRLQKFVGSTTSSITSSIAKSAQTAAYTAALALAKRTAPHDVTPATSVTSVTSATSATPENKPLPLVIRYPQKSEYDQKMTDLQDNLKRIRKELDAERSALNLNLADSSHPGRPGIIDADKLLGYITSGRTNVDRLQKQEASIKEQISMHATSRHATSRRGGKSKQSKRSKRVSSKRGLTKRRKH